MFLSCIVIESDSTVRIAFFQDILLVFWGMHPFIDSFFRRLIVYSDILALCVIVKPKLIVYRKTDRSIWSYM